MALSDIQQFIVDLLLRWDPDLDVSQGSLVETRVIAPLLARIGPDPFDNDITTFITERIRQVYPDIAITEVDAAADTLIDPMRTLLEPLVREIKLIKLRASLRNAESLSDDEIDALAANFFEARAVGGLSRGVVRLYFANPQSASVTLINPARTRTGLRFYPTRPQTISVDQMILNREGTEYYFDVNYTAEMRGSEYNVDPGTITSVAALPSVTRVVNLTRFRDGLTRETSLDFLTRVEAGQGDKTMAVSRGAVHQLGSAFPAARHLFVVGYGDPEMQRDILTGGGVGPIPADDQYGRWYGTGTVYVESSVSPTSQVLFLEDANLIARVGSTGTAPEGWYVTLSFYLPVADEMVAVDAKILAVYTDEVLLVDYAFGIGDLPSAVVWALRRNVLTISDIPGGITLPNANGQIEVVPGTVHLGGKTDIYTIGPTEKSSAQLLGIADVSPLTRGVAATTNASTMVDLVDLDPDVGIPLGAASLVLEEGADAGSYRILARSGTELLIDTELTGSQVNLNWRIVDDIDFELTDPRDIRLEGSDLITAAGSAVVSTIGAVNFTDAGVQVGDVLKIPAGACEGEYQVTNVGAVTLEVDPVMPRLTTSGYSVFRRLEAVQVPLVRVSSMELLDSSGAPVGTKIPYANPVLVESRAFQNEGSGYLFDGPVRTGLLLGTDFSDVSGKTWEWATFRPEAIWAGPVASGTVTIAGNTIGAVIAAITDDLACFNAGVSAVQISNGGTPYVGIVSSMLVRNMGGTALDEWDTFPGGNNAFIQVEDNAFAKVGLGDLIEVLDGANAGTQARAVGVYAGEIVLCGQGPVGPVGAEGLYDNQVFRPSTNVRVRIGRGAVGSGRAYFLDPTSVDFRYLTTRFAVEGLREQLLYRPDPENTRILLPAQPLTTLPTEGVLNDGVASLEDSTINFLAIGIIPGDVLVVKFRPIEGDDLGLPTGDIALAGLTMRLRFDAEPYITVSFPTDMTRQEAVDYINEQVGATIADLNGFNAVRLRSSRFLEIANDSTARAILGLGSSPSNTTHPDAGEYVISNVLANELVLSAEGAQPNDTTASTQYQIRRYVQRTSSTEMALKKDATGLYYADVEIVAMAPGDQYNIEAGAPMESTGHVADGYVLRTENAVTSYSVAEIVHATLSPSILLPGSADSPEQAVQLSRQNVQVNYDRSGLVDEMQSFASSELQRTLLGEVLIKHLLPHYVSLDWVYSGGLLEPQMQVELRTWIDGVNPGGEELEVGDLTGVLRKAGATSTYTPDSSTPSGRRAPFIVVVYHDEHRRVRARIIRDVVDTMRLQGFVPDTIKLARA